MRFRAGGALAGPYAPDLWLCRAAVHAGRWAVPRGLKGGRPASAHHGGPYADLGDRFYFGDQGSSCL